MVVFVVVVDKIQLCLTVQTKGKDDESVSDLTMSSQTKGNGISLMLNSEQGGHCSCMFFHSA